MRRSCLWTIALPLALSIGKVCGAAEPLEVFVGIPPQAGLIECVGGEHVAVHVLVQPGQEPHTFEPTPRQIMALGRATLYFKVGMPFENRLLEKIQASHQQLTVVDTTNGIKKRAMAGHRRHTRGHDPHVWLSPPLIKIQAKNIADGLSIADPAHAKTYEHHLSEFLVALDQTHNRIRAVLAPYKGRSFYVFHPAFGYFGDAYGLEQEAVEIEGRSPTPKQLGGLIKKAKAENVKIIFVQPQFDKRSVDVVARAIGGAVIPMDPLATDVLKNLEDIAAKMEEALRAAGR